MPEELREVRREVSHKFLGLKTFIGTVPVCGKVMMYISILVRVFFLKAISHTRSALFLSTRPSSVIVAVGGRMAT
jgi:hypothetical protein